MSVAVITGSAGLIGSEAAAHFAAKSLHIVGVDNDMRQRFFGAEASTHWNKERLEKNLGKNYSHHNFDIRESEHLEKVFKQYGKEIVLVIHTAAQPSHDWAAREPKTDFTINANGTLNVLEAVRANCPDAVLIFTSTNKVYGDTPNRLPLLEQETRWEIDPAHKYKNGIAEDMSIDSSLHSLFGASKVAADVLVQEYGRYFGMKTACFRGGCLTGPAHSGTELHGFLAYLMRATDCNLPYTIYGYKAKQVRDNIHSRDLIAAFQAFFDKPRSGEAYNIGGGRDSNCSMLEAIEAAEKISGKKLQWTYSETARSGDHIWWISDNSKFAGHYPSWRITKNVDDILHDIYEFNHERWKLEAKV